MDWNYITRTPESFSFCGRTHRVSSWKELVHELIEDLLAGMDPEGKKLLDLLLPGPGKEIFLSGGSSSHCLRLSNGRNYPEDYAEEDYARACRDICLIYGITPCEMGILFAPFETLPAQDLPEEKPGETAAPEPEEIRPEPDAPVLPLEPERSPHMISRAEETWLKLMSDSRAKLSDSVRILPIQETPDEVPHEPDWDEITEMLASDRQNLSAVKLMKKSGIRPPSIVNYRGLLRSGKIGGEALLVWMDEGVAYLHGLQKYGTGYFLSRNFSHVFVDDPRGLIKCMQNLEADNE